MEEFNPDYVNPDVAKMFADNLIKEQLEKLKGKNCMESRKSKVHLRLLKKLADREEVERKANFRSRW